MIGILPFLIQWISLSQLGSKNEQSSYYYYQPGTTTAGSEYSPKNHNHWTLLNDFQQLPEEEIEHFLPQICNMIVDREASLGSGRHGAQLDPDLFEYFEDILVRKCAGCLTFGMRLCGVLKASQHAPSEGLFKSVLLQSSQASISAQRREERMRIFQEKVEKSSSYGHNLSPALSSDRCTYYRDYLFLLDNLARLGIELKTFPESRRSAHLKHALSQCNALLYYRMLSKGRSMSSLHTSMHELYAYNELNPVGIAAMCPAIAQFSLHLPLLHCPDTVLRLLRFVESECDILPSKDRCPYLVTVEVLEQEHTCRSEQLYSCMSSSSPALPQSSSSSSSSNRGGRSLLFSSDGSYTGDYSELSEAAARPLFSGDLSVRPESRRSEQQQQGIDGTVRRDNHTSSTYPPSNGVSNQYPPSTNGVSNQYPPSNQYPSPEEYPHANENVMVFSRPHVAVAAAADYDATSSSRRSTGSPSPHPHPLGELRGGNQNQPPNNSNDDHSTNDSQQSHHLNRPVDRPISYNRQQSDHHTSSHVMMQQPSDQYYKDGIRRSEQFNHVDMQYSDPRERLNDDQYSNHNRQQSDQYSNLQSNQYTSRPPMATSPMHQATFHPHDASSAPAAFGYGHQSSQGGSIIANPPPPSSSSDFHRPVARSYRRARSWLEKKDAVRRQSPFGHLTGWDLKSFIVKSGDDLRKEVVAMQLIQFCKQVFEWEGLDIYLKPYQILSTGLQAGLVEFLEGTQSVDRIKKGLPRGFNALKDHFELNFGESYSFVYAKALQNFVRSLAGYSLVTYIVQVKDRHNANILVDADGHLIHIDYGFILGDSPGFNINFESAPFKFPLEYLELMGGVDSAAFKSFEDLFLRGFLAMQKHIDGLTSIVQLFYGDKRRNAADGIRSRLLFPQSHSDIISLIGDSCDNWRTKQYDWYQEKTNNIQT